MPDRLEELSAACDATQRAWAIARLTSKDDTEAARRVGITPDTVYMWRARGYRQHDELLEELGRDAIHAARFALKQALGPAVAVKVAGLGSRHEGIRQAASTEIQDRNLGKPSVPVELGATGAIASLVEAMLGRLAGNAAPDEEED
jgi:hypothetical protein